ncbi:helix-turn-helix domain-containing protein [Aliiglaciecola lipolytica]|uniref:helix-turn-helix domain-containing protein n=1 Tax=Aliiglaciecola lipolytica TaxID=477689 RepID=UPI001C09BFBD|nr:helix-turn-helix transcriptional regulator [Aliiglaciecola lipolytica]MBU2877067.1 helix-turn-helix transcriptional regulator [Aliiglaciecola lipolytica]
MIKINLQQMMLDHAAKKGAVVTIDEISKQTGLGRNTLSRIKNDPYRSTSTDIINKLCLYFNCSIQEILILEED